MISREGKDLLHGPSQRGPHAKAAIVENSHRDLETGTHLAQDVLHGHLGVVEVHLRSIRALDAHLLLRRTVGHAAKRSLHNEGGNLVLLLARVVLVVHLSLGKHRENLSKASVRNPELSSIQNEVLCDARDEEMRV